MSEKPKQDIELRPPSKKVDRDMDRPPGALVPVDRPRLPSDQRFGGLALFGSVEDITDTTYYDDAGSNNLRSGYL